MSDDEGADAGEAPQRPADHGNNHAAITTNVPLPGKLVLKGNLSENWKKWRQVWDAYETVSGLVGKPSKYRVATFITCIGVDALEIHNGLSFNSDEEKNDIEKVLELWDNYCVGKTNVIYERYKFNERVQAPDESIDAYLTALRKLAATCDFKTLNDELIRVRDLKNVIERRNINSNSYQYFPGRKSCSFFCTFFNEEKSLGTAVAK